MPALRLASAPNRNATIVATTIPITTPAHGFQPRFSPFVFPFVTTLPRAKPATPKIEIWASETIPPYAERKIRLAATMPRKKTWVRMKLIQ